MPSNAAKKRNCDLIKNNLETHIFTGRHEQRECRLYDSIESKGEIYCNFAFLIQGQQCEAENGMRPVNEALHKKNGSILTICVFVLIGQISSVCVCVCQAY